MKFKSIFSYVVIVELLAGYWSDTVGQTAETITMFEDTRCLSLCCNDWRWNFTLDLNKFIFPYHCIMISTYF